MLAVTVAYEFTLFTDSYQWMPAVICPTYFFPLTCFSVLAGIMRVTDKISESRSGILATEGEIARLNEILVPLVKQGQSIHQIYLTHKDELMCSEKTLYNYVDGCLFDIRNIDLPRKVKYRPRYKKPELKVDRGCRYLIRCPPLGSQSIVNSFCQRTLLYFTASVAYIWRFKAMGTYFFFIMLAVTVAYEFTLFTDSYQWMPAVICPTYFFPLT